LASKVAVVAVGGNALTREDQPGTAQQIEENAVQMAGGICALADAGWRVVVVHGNGPQVGNLIIQQEMGAGLVPPQPLSMLNAMTEGQIGSALVLAINSIRGPGSAVALVSHMTVSPTTRPSGTRPSRSARSSTRRTPRKCGASAAGR